MNDVLKEVQGTKSEKQKIGKLLQKADELGMVVTTENCGNLKDANNVIYVITLMIWVEFKKKFIHYIEKNNLDFDREDFCIDFKGLRHEHFVVTHKRNIFDLDRFVDGISELNEEHVFKEMSWYLGIKEK